jgi:CDP-diglyceride synthetase
LGEDAQSGGSGLLSFASLVLSVLGFLTLLRLADRQERTPARALGLFLSTTAESVGGTVLGVAAIKRAPDTPPNRTTLLAAAGLVLGVITTLLNVTWMRTRRRP